jgi:aspartokinase-like uncharacterized kinase
VGGSLFDLPDLGPRLARFLHSLPPHRPLLVPGGGPTTDVIRTFDRRFGLGEETAHGLALRALSLNAHVLAALLPGAEVVGTRQETNGALERHGLPILDPRAFLRHEEEISARLPHTWDAASDCVAAGVALALGADALILLKSLSIPEGAGWDELVRRGWVDPAFADYLRRRERVPVVRTVNLRDDEWA